MHTRKSLQWHKLRRINNAFLTPDHICIMLYSVKYYDSSAEFRNYELYL